MLKISLGGEIITFNLDKKQPSGFSKEWVATVDLNIFLKDTTKDNEIKYYRVTIIHHLILRRPDFPFFNAVCLGWLQYFPSKEVLSVRFLHECLTPAVSNG